MIEIMSSKKLCLREDRGQGIQNIAFIDLLNDHCLANIFTYLPLIDRIEMGKVCKRWRYVNDLPWCDTTKFHCTDNVNCSSLPQSQKLNQMNVRKVLLHCSDTLQQLKICEDCFSSISIAPQKFNALRSLTLHACILDDNTMSQITQISTLLHLDMSYCTLKQGASSISNLVNLEHLCLKKVIGVDNGVIMDIANKCSHLKFLDITYIRRLTELTLMELAKLENLEQLIINAVINVADDMFIKMRSKLHVLECKYCRDVTDVGIIGILRNCPNLHRLDVRGTEVSIETLIQAAKETKRRKNNVVLRLTADRLITQEFHQLEYVSPLLIIDQDDSSSTSESSDSLVSAHRYDDGYEFFTDQQWNEFSPPPHDPKDLEKFWENYTYEP